MMKGSEGGEELRGTGGGGKGVREVEGGEGEGKDGDDWRIKGWEGGGKV